MSVAVWAHLPPNVSVRNVAKVIGRLLGQPAQKKPLTSGGWYTEVIGVSVETIDRLPECARILVNGPNVSWESLFHFESEDGRKLISFSPYYDLDMAVARGLCDFFGGYLIDERKPRKRLYTVTDKSGKRNNPNKDKDFEVFQKRLLALKAVSP